MLQRLTTDLRAALERIPRLTSAAGRPAATPQDLAAALCAPLGNVAALWSDPAAEPAPPAKPGASLPTTFDPAGKRVLEQALTIALQEGAGHIGTEHLLAAVVRTAPSDVVDWLAARGATAEAVDALLAGLHGGPGAERLVAEPFWRNRRKWRRATAVAQGHPPARPPRSPLIAAIVLVVIAGAVLTLCVWGP